MAKVISRRFDAVAKLEIVLLEDDFGAQMVLQHPLAQDGYYPAAEEAAALALLDSNAQKFAAHVLLRESGADLQAPPPPPPPPTPPAKRRRERT